MKKIFRNSTIILFVIIILISIMFIGKIVYDNYQIKSFANAFGKYAETNEEIVLNEITNFKWDEMYIIGPYTYSDKVSEIIGIKTKLENSSNDNYQQLIFIRDGGIVYEVTFDRYNGDLIYNPEGPYTPEEAIFIKEDNKLLLK